MGKTKVSIAIIGEGETEWFYFDSLRRSKRYSFSIEPSLPQHADIEHIMKLVSKAVFDQYDYVFCLVDMDRIMATPKERERYVKYVNTYKDTKVTFIESMPCTEFWFLLHFWEHCRTKIYPDYNSLLPELKKHLQGYEKTKDFFRKNSLYEILAKQGNLKRAKEFAEELTKKSKNNTLNETFSYSEIFRVLDALEKIGYGF
ncbi:hypothetical protein EZS27_001285 [termite gut metagenome]|uniref:RloB domain-containing protein n=1 Tax=termite gut metagenome TaxID=433724 RepID=A0A5J4T030_9ZZZZ